MPIEPTNPAPETTYFICSAGGRRLALPLPQVERVVRAVLITPLPQPIPGFAGVVNVHGEVAAVIALHYWLQSPEAARGDHLVDFAPQPQLTDHFVLVRQEGRLLALWVESLEGVATISNHNRVPAPNPLSGSSTQWHLLKSGDSMVLELELPLLLATAPGDWHRILTDTPPEP